MRPDHGVLALKVGMAALFFLFYVSVSELFLPTTWMFLGLVYWRLDQQRHESRAMQIREASSTAEGSLLHPQRSCPPADSAVEVKACRLTKLKAAFESREPKGGSFA